MSFLAIISRDPSAADKALKAEQQRTYVRDVWIVIASIITFLILIRAARFLLSLVFSPKPTDQSSSSAHFPSKKGDVEALQPQQNGQMSLRRLPAAFMSTFRVIAFRLNIPIGPGSVATVAELLFILGYIATMLVLCFVHTEDLDAFFWEDRAAHLASCQLPLIVALAGKNNIISFFTGIGHEKLNILHRAAARTCLLFLWMHAITRAASGLPEKFDFTHGWMRCGATGLVAFTLATVLSIRPIRNAFFEFFLIAHIVLIGIFLVTGFIHARHPGFGDYIWPALVLWGFDRGLRGLRVLWNNRFRASGDHHGSTATVELLSADTVRLTLRRKFNWRPGQHAYVVLPTVSTLPTEAHPFTIASIPDALNGEESSYSDEKDVSFIIRGRDGFTSRLRKYANANGGSAVTAFIDGPYGCPPDLTHYSTCILIAGGSGVSYALPLLLNLVHKARAQKSAVRRVVFVWSVRDPEHIRWISKHLTEALTAAASTSLIIEPRLYVTGAAPFSPEAILRTFAYDSEKSSISGESPLAETPLSEKDAKLPTYSAIQVIHGRPSIRKIIQDEVAAAVGPVSVDVAGPSGLSQSVAKALASDLTSAVSVMKGTPPVTLHTETFGMSK